MQDRPDKEALLDAVARFLERDVRGALQDPGLAFRVLIAANLARIAAAEIRGEDAQDEAELGRLRALLPQVDLGELAPPANEGHPARGREGRREATRRLDLALCLALRDGTLAGDERAAAFAHVRQTLREKLAVVNPRFDLRAAIDEIS